jgi:hypothetical protein
MTADAAHWTWLAGGTLGWYVLHPTGLHVGEAWRMLDAANQVMDEPDDEDDHT